MQFYFRNVNAAFAGLVRTIDKGHLPMTRQPSRYGEVLQVDEMVQDMIMGGATAKDIARACVQAKTMRTLKADALSKVVKGLTTLEEAAGAVML